MKSHNKIWLELATDDKENQAMLATKMLHRCGYNEHVKIVVGIRGSYLLILNEHEEYVELVDNGHWFNLDRMSGETK